MNRLPSVVEGLNRKQKLDLVRDFEVVEDVGGVDISADRLRKLGFTDTLDVQEILSTKIGKETEEEHVARVKNYFEVVEEIRKVDKRAITILNQNFGIINFDRYGSERMIRQLKEMKTPESPSGYAAVFYAVADYNGAFGPKSGSMGTMERYEAFQNETAEGRKVRYFEVKKPRDFSTLIGGSYVKYGKISSLMVGAHSNGPNLELNRIPKSSVSDDEEALIEDVLTEHIKKMSPLLFDKVFTSDCYAIVDSCLAGSTEKDFAAIFSSVFRDRFVLAPDQISKTLGFKDTGKAYPEIDFAFGISKSEEIKSDPRIYRNGEIK